MASTNTYIYLLKKQLISIEKLIAGISLFLLLMLALAQVVLRNLFEIGFSEID